MPILVGIAIAAALARDVWRLVLPQRRLLQGRYADARAAAEGLERSWMRVFPNVRRSARYTIALALHLEGKLDDALAILDALLEEPLDDRLRYAVRSLEAGTLVLAGRDPSRAADAIAEARALRDTREDALVAAIALLDAGRAEEAADAFERAARMKAPRLRTRIDAAMEAALRGLYLVRAGRASEAERDLEAAAAGHPSNVYVERARALLAPAVADDVEGPASLAPHVID